MAPRRLLRFAREAYHAPTIGCPEESVIVAHRLTAEQLIDDLTAVIRDAESLLRATVADTEGAVGEVRARAEESVRQAKARLAGIEEQTLERARVVAGEADDYVRGNPWQAVGIAAGIGLVIGLLVGRR